MIRTLLFLSASWMVCMASGFAPGIFLPENQLVPAPIVTSASSQYFERIFNRLVVAPPVLEAPLIPFAPAVIPASLQPATSTPAPPQAVPVETPNVAIAIASAQAAPIATILLPPYPFGPPPPVGFLPSVNIIPTNPPKRDTEPTTERVKPTTPTPASKPVPAPSSNNNFLQGLPSNENLNFNQYLAPKPQKLKTSVEVVPVPLAYIAPPPMKHFHAKHVHKFVPTNERIILRPVTSHNSYVRIKVPVRIVKYKRIYKPSHFSSKIGSQNLQSFGRYSVPEPTTARPFNKPALPSTKPPRV